MKKYLLIIALIILSMSVIISCDNANKTPTTEEKPSTSEDNPTTPVTSEIVILDFSEVENSRGLTNFPVNSPFNSIERGDYKDEHMWNDTNYSFWLNCNVMRSLPVFPGLKSANASADAFVNSIKNKNLTGYGFPIKVVKAETTSDGVYIIYDVLEEDKHNGRIEYYYSTKENKFSYREIVAPLYGNNGGDQIFVFELFNVPVEKTQNGYAFKAGELYENGSSFRHISFIDSTSLGHETPNNTITNMLIEDAKLLMNYNNTSVTSMEYEKYTTLDLIPLNVITGGKQPSIDISIRPNALQIENQVDFLQKVFKDKSFAFTGYSTLEEFNNSNVEFIEGRIEEINNSTTKERTNKVMGFPLSYDLNKKIGACLYFENSTVHESNTEKGVPNSFTEFVLERFKSCFGEDIKTFDQFVSLMFKNLGLPKYAESVELRKNLLKNSYN